MELEDTEEKKSQVMKFPQKASDKPRINTKTTQSVGLASQEWTGQVVNLEEQCKGQKLRN